LIQLYKTSLASTDLLPLPRGHVLVVINVSVCLCAKYIYIYIYIYERILVVFSKRSAYMLGRNRLVLGEDLDSFMDPG